MIPKFRAWDKKLKKMFEVSFIDFDTKLIGLNINLEIIIFDFDDVVLMQSTGLKDKNGKEIFEGDVVRIFDSLYTVFYDNEEGSYRLKPHDERWVIDYMSNFSHGGNFEVVGNIYENKE